MSQRSDVLVRNDASSGLTGPEILLAAIGEVRVSEGSVIVAAGHSPGSGVDLMIAPRSCGVSMAISAVTMTSQSANDVLISPSRDLAR